MKTKKETSSHKKAKRIIPRVKVAFKNDFFLETSYLVSLAIEARLRTLISRNDRMHPGAGFTFEQCLKRIKFLIMKDPEGLLSVQIKVDLIDAIRTWKNQRNLILKAVESSHVSRKRIQNLAVDGINLMERLNEAYKKYKSEWKRSLQKVPAEQKKNERLPEE